VVELAVAEIIALNRRLSVHNDAMHAGIWRKSAKGSHELRGRRLGIVGYGKIGSQLSVLAEALGMRVSFFDTADRLALGNARRCATLDELLGDSDVVTLHVDGRPGNSGLFGEEQFARMLPGALFLNLSRGFVVDHCALRRNIDSGHLAGAAVDVFPDEPAAAGDPFGSELRGLPNVILTPHIGGSTEEAQQDIGEFVAAKLVGYLQHGATGLSVNLPEVQPPRAAATTRLALLHRNQGGHAGLRQRPARRRGRGGRAAGVRHLRLGRLRGHRRARPTLPGRGPAVARSARDHPGPRAVRLSAAGPGARGEWSRAASGGLSAPGAPCAQMPVSAGRTPRWTACTRSAWSRSVWSA
jgi:hypothetical protein